MSNRKTIASTLTFAATALAGSMALAGVASADTTNPFGLTALSSGYQVAMDEGKCGNMGAKKGEGKCGNMGAKKEGKCGEGKCGGNK